MRKLEIRGASGLGDAVYVYPVAEYYKARGYDVVVRTKYPDVFSPLNIKTIPFNKNPKADIVATYSNRKANKTNQLEDVLINARLPQNYPFKINWTIKNKFLVNRVREQTKGKKICVLSMPHQPFARPDTYGDKLKPDFKLIQKAIGFLKRKGWAFVMVGRGACVARLNNIDMDMRNKTTVSDSFDIFSIADGFMGQVGHIVPIAEIFNKPLFTLFSRAGLRSPDAFIRGITGEKVLSGEKSIYAIDDEPESNVIERIRKVFVDG